MLDDIPLTKGAAKINHRKQKTVNIASIVFWLLLVLTPLWWGWTYYTTSLSDRPWHPQHELLKPTGLVGHGLGVFGSLLIIAGVTSYSSRKRIQRFHRWGKLQSWLRFHIFVCTLGAAWVVLHTTFKLSGLVAISFWSMILVVASGVFGRYLYVRIPKTAEGSFWNVNQLQEERDQLREQLKQTTGLTFQDLKEAGFQVETGMRTSLSRAMALAFQHDFQFLTWKKHWQTLVAHRNFNSEMEQEVAGIVKRLVRNAKQQSIILPFQKLFNYWHVFHIPMTAVMFVILAVHVVVALLFGYIWIF